MLAAGFLRSPYARARIRPIDLDAARRARGIVLALSGSDLADIRPLPDMGSRLTKRWLDRVRPRTQFPRQRLLAEELTHWVGEPVAVVVGGDRYLVEDALDAIAVDYEPLEPVVDLRRAAHPDAPKVHPELEDNVIFDFEVALGDAAGAFATAERTLRRRIRSGRNAAVPLECRVTAAVPNVRTGELTVYSGTQTPHTLRRTTAECLGMPESAIRVIVPDVGGGFGGKNSVYPEEVLVAYLARRLGRPVKWVEDRRENLLSMTQGRDQDIEAEAAFDGDGRVLAVRVNQWLDCGAYEPQGPVVTYQTFTHLLGPYRIRHLQFHGRSVATNKAPQAPYRGAGRPEAVLVMESLMDGVASELSLDPAEVRQRNLIGPQALPYNVGIPFRDGNDVVYDSGNYPELLNRVLDTAGYHSLRSQQAERRKLGGKLLGIGLACYVEATGTGPFEGAAISIDPSGEVTLATGGCSQGQGHEISLAQVVAELWMIEPERVRVVLGDTAHIAYGAGTYASRTLQLVSAAAVEASANLREKLRLLAAGLLEATADDIDVDLQNRRLAVKGDPSRAVSLAQVARAAAPGWGSTGAGDGAGLQATAYFAPSTQAWASAAHLALVEVDPAHATVIVKRFLVCHDAGRVINPLLAEGQIVGGVATGLGGALLEEVVYDEAGQLLTGTLMDYLIPAATDVPNVELDHIETLNPNHPLGVKGLGEGGTVGAPAAIARAIADALQPLGVDVDTLPVTPERLFRLLQGEAQPSHSAK